jgi:hypothetical protein
VGQRERSPGFTSLASRLRFRDDFLNAISMKATSSACPTGRLSRYSIGQATPSARPLTAPAVRINTIAPSVLTSTHVPALLTGKPTQRGPMSVPSIPDASRRVRPSTFDRRDREELREPLARMLAQIRYAATAFVVGMNMACEAPCWSEIAHGNDERTGQRADTGDVTIITANAGMIKMNFIDRHLVPYDSAH